MTLASEGAPAITVVIPTVDRPELLVRSIDGVLGGRFQDFEIVVVDQSKGDRSRRAIADRYGSDPRVRYCHSDVTGVSQARNVGIEQARGEIIVYLDDDAVPVEGWLEAYATAFRELSPPPGVIGGRTVLEWERPRPSWYPRRFLPLLGMHDAGDELGPFAPGDFPVGANFAVRRSILAAVGRFDPNFGFDVGRPNPLIGGDDTQFCLKVMSAGHGVYYHPQAVVRHLVRSSKLDRRYFLRRCYWHGRTTAQLRARGDGDRRSWIATWRDARQKKRAAPRGDTAALPLQERAMLASGYAAIAMGLAAESVARRVGRGEPSS